MRRLQVGGKTMDSWHSLGGMNGSIPLMSLHFQLRRSLLHHVQLHRKREKWKSLYQSSQQDKPIINYVTLMTTHQVINISCVFSCWCSLLCFLLFINQKLKTKQRPVSNNHLITSHNLQYVGAFSPDLLRFWTRYCLRPRPCWSE